MPIAGNEIPDQIVGPEFDEAERVGDGISVIGP
jgi:hypothetical protein